MQHHSEINCLDDPLCVSFLHLFAFVTSGRDPEPVIYGPGELLV